MEKYKNSFTTKYWKINIFMNVFFQNQSYYSLYFALIGVPEEIFKSKCSWTVRRSLSRTESQDPTTLFASTKLQIKKELKDYP